jgi:hypothetical protein
MDKIIYRKTQRKQEKKRFLMLSTESGISYYKLGILYYIMTYSEKLIYSREKKPDFR